MVLDQKQIEYPFTYQKNYENKHIIKYYFKSEKSWATKHNQELFFKNIELQKIFRQREENYNKIIDILMVYLPLELCEIIIKLSHPQIPKKKLELLFDLKNKCLTHFNNFVAFSEVSCCSSPNISTANKMMYRSNIMFVNLNEYYRVVLNLESQNIYYKSKYTCPSCSKSYFNPYDACYCCHTK